MNNLFLRDTKIVEDYFNELENTSYNFNIFSTGLILISYRFNYKDIRAVIENNRVSIYLNDQYLFADNRLQLKLGLRLKTIFYNNKKLVDKITRTVNKPITTQEIIERIDEFDVIINR